MGAKPVNGGGNGARSGALTLSVLAAPLNVLVLRALRDGPTQQAVLRRTVGSPAQTTLRAQVKRLMEIGAIEQRRRNRFPGVLEYELAASGRELLFVLDVLDRWLAKAPDGPLRLGDNAAKAAIKALAEGWSTTMLRALAGGPLALTELDGVIGGMSYPSLERRLAAMRLAGQVEPCPSTGRGTPHAVTRWLRQGVGPIAAAVRWERRCQSHSSAPVSRLDMEAIFLLALPLLRLPSEISGHCRTVAELSNGKRQGLASVVVEIDGGRVASCATQLQHRPDAWAMGSAGAWLDAMIERDADRLELSGNSRLASLLLDGLNAALFSAARPSTLDAEI